VETEYVSIETEWGGMIPEDVNIVGWNGVIQQTNRRLMAEVRSERADSIGIHMSGRPPSVSVT
jgi:hypothetical protein